ncbi:hypothetical protein MNBD_GAMMA05-2602 [hydrothermal vent metagenome]|uniref:Uncharacterized protein n=1 Tax=hydrothermal vent metagenome TaxID=652676 RepID=A0A3B0X466_9ZZZZ
MNFKCLKPACSGALFLLVYSTLSAAASVEPVQAREFSKNLSLAVHEYEQENYAASKEYYERVLVQALNLNKSTASIYYNLGSVSYKLELYNESERYFKKLINHPDLNAVAYYNLALIENKRSKKKAAINFFYTSKKLTTDKQLSRLIDQQLFKISKKKSERARKKTMQDWYASFRLGTGYDSNISFAPLEISSNKSGDFIRGIGIFDKRIAGEGYGIKKSALYVTSLVFLSNYYSTDFNDYNLFDIGLRYLKPINKWRNAFEFNVKKTTYGHRDYQRIYSATLKTRKKLKSGDTLRLRYRYEEVESLNVLFNYLEGSRQRLRAGYQLKWPAESVYMWYELELNNRENTIRRNYSPTRNTLRLRYEKKINITNKAYAEIAYRDSDYDSTPTQDRQDKRKDFLLAYVNDLAADWQLLAHWRFTHNRSTESIFSYDRHVVMLNLRFTF